MMEAVRTSETSVDNHFTRQYIPEDNSERVNICLYTWYSQRQPAFLASEMFKLEPRSESLTRRSL
jgi:hypothetical protein